MRDELCYVLSLWSRQIDARSLSPQAQEALRLRAVKAMDGGMKQTEAGRVTRIASSMAGAT